MNSFFDIQSKEERTRANEVHPDIRFSTSSLAIIEIKLLLSTIITKLHKNTRFSTNG